MERASLSSSEISQVLSGVLTTRRGWLVSLSETESVGRSSTSRFIRVEIWRSQFTSGLTEPSWPR